MGIAIDVLVMVPQLIAIIDSMGALPLVMSMLNMNQALVFNRALRIIAIAVPTSIGILHHYKTIRIIQHLT